MAKRIVQMHDKHKSTTNLYPKITMGSLSPQVKAYIEGQGDDKFVKIEEIKSQYKSSKILSEGDEIHLQITDTENNMYGELQISDSEFLVEVGTTDADYYQISLTNTGDFAITTNDGTNTHQLTFDAEGNLKVDGQDVGGGGKQLYLHCISGEKDAGNEYANIQINVINDDATPLTLSALYDYVKNKANKTHTSMSGNTRYLYQATGMARDIGYSQYGAICGVYACTQVGAEYLIIVYGGGSAQNFYYMTSFSILRDDVITL